MIKEKTRKQKAKIFERSGYRNNLEQGEKAIITQYFDNGCYEVFGLTSKVLERVYGDEIQFI